MSVLESAERRYIKVVVNQSCVRLSGFSGLIACCFLFGCCWVFGGVGFVVFAQSINQSRNIFITTCQLNNACTWYETWG